MFYLQLISYFPTIYYILLFIYYMIYIIYYKYVSMTSYAYSRHSLNNIHLK